MNADTGRSESSAEKHAAYVQTVEGKLRLDLAWANLCSFLPSAAANHTSRALDVGGGTGALAIRLAGLGFLVTVVDTSSDMLAFAQQAVQQAGATDYVRFEQASAADLAEIFPQSSCEVVICHNVLEYLDDPSPAVRGIAYVLKHTKEAVASIAVRNRAGEVLKAAIKAGDLALAAETLDLRKVREPLGGEYVSLYNLFQLRHLLAQASLEVIAERGLRVFADYLPGRFFEQDGAYARVLALERRLGARPEFAAIARYTQVLVRASDNRN